MSNLEKLLYNGLEAMDKVMNCGWSKDDWWQLMAYDPNWDNLDSKITLNDLWEICKFLSERQEK